VFVAAAIGLAVAVLKSPQAAPAQAPAEEAESEFATAA
jgi:hypothetical protein